MRSYWIDEWCTKQEEAFHITTMVQRHINDIPGCFYGWARKLIHTFKHALSVSRSMHISDQNIP